MLVAGVLLVRVPVEEREGGDIDCFIALLLLLFVFLSFFFQVFKGQGFSQWNPKIIEVFFMNDEFKVFVLHMCVLVFVCLSVY